MRALFLSAHLDDAEGAAAGMMLRLNELDYVDSVAFSDDGRFEEAVRSHDALGIQPPKIPVQIPVRDFPVHRKEILDALVDLSKTGAYDLVFCPSSTDTHQDHKTLYEETIRAFRWGTAIHGYDFPWNANPPANLTYFVELSEVQLARKIESLACYKSQMGKRNRAITPKYVRALAIERGNTAGVQYAEAFEVIRSIWKQ